MPQKKKSTGRRSEPKLFRCTGFGDCNMVFTRSEHLARHARKHTGEKPFKCVVPTCDRMFSRFDNMMQHTHTHKRIKKKDEKSSNGSTPSNSMPSTPNSEQKSFPEHRILPRSDDSYDHYYYMYYPPPYFYAPPLVSPTFNTTKKKQEVLSVSNTKLSVELSTPIQELANEMLSTDDEESICSQSTIQITPDEFEALQGFGKFCTEPVIREPILMTRITPSPNQSITYPLPPLHSPTAVLSNHLLDSKVNAFRQHISPIHESFQRART